ncbi:hypothetical protein PMI15_04449 [Polaromonas sp. CF318]|uniref:hypothetical protein n=1 Tax=Polaromonas sp. CF318 TaxID=1144318 RepID=UPI0002711833|nr:hypothetical protein [Polaromonas sp. CF318]EJL77994.1 hypothetical protein PMI15_04449 [Polaromonas sp. CF318]
MNQFPDHGASDGDSGAADAQGLPPAQALLAGTLALMTGHAQACCEGQRALLAQKIIANLFMLSRHAGAPPDFRAIAANLHPLWVRVLQPGADQPPQVLLPTDNFDPHRVLWHTTPETLQ